MCRRFFSPRSPCTSLRKAIGIFIAPLALQLLGCTLSLLLGVPCFSLLRVFFVLFFFCFARRVELGRLLLPLGHQGRVTVRPSGSFCVFQFGVCLLFISMFSAAAYATRPIIAHREGSLGTRRTRVPFLVFSASFSRCRARCL